jgi:XapX domain-containing protein
MPTGRPDGARRKTMLKTMIGLLVGLLIGAGCRWFEVPLPSPPKLFGVLLVVAMTVGYIGIDKVIASRSVAANSAAIAESRYASTLKIEEKTR